MLTADISILYVSNVMRSADFYSALLEAEPVEKGPTFALFILSNGFKLGLWSRYTVEPAVNQAPAIATGELMFTVGEKDEVDAMYYAWGVKHKVTVIQKPTQLDFGYAFAALDPDGHRLRVGCLEDEA